jgi:hypothetical protein
MTFYSEMADVADDLIIEFGQTVTHRVQSGTAYDPDTGSSSVSYVDSDGHGCMVEFDKDVIDGTKVRIGDKLCLLSPIGVTEPKDGDKIVIGSETWSVVPPVSVVAPAGVACLYEVQLRMDESGAVAPTPTIPANITAPVISGNTAVGSVLTTTIGNWSGLLPMTPSYQWRADGVNISLETASTYTTLIGDVSKYITCRVTVTNADGSSGANSNAIVPA